MINLLPFVVPLLSLTFAQVFVFDVPSPFAAAGDEWIKGDQQGELFEALAEFSHCRLSSFRQRELITGTQWVSYCVPCN